MLIDSKNLAKHRPWIAVFVLGTLASSVWFFLASVGADAWPGGSSPPGFTFGILGGLLCLFEFALWGRKKLRTWRIGRAQTWMVAHIWLGLLSVPLLVYHCGFRWGGPLSAALMALFLIVIASGIWGLVLQQIIPRKMLSEIPAETIHSQVDLVARNLTQEANRLIRATCGPAPGQTAVDDDFDDEEDDGTVNHLTVGAVRTVGDVRGKVLETKAPAAAIPGAEPLRAIYQQKIAPYILEGGKKSHSPLARTSDSNSFFRDLRSRFDPAAHDAINVLEGFCNQRRQLDLQGRLHVWLHGWLLVHLPLSMALIALMFIHVYVALKFWYS